MTNLQRTDVIAWLGAFGALYASYQILIQPECASRAVCDVNSGWVLVGGLVLLILGVVLMFLPYYLEEKASKEASLDHFTEGTK